jgi:hypothetical protein
VIMETGIYNLTQDQAGGQSGFVGGNWPGKIPSSRR